MSNKDTLVEKVTNIYESDSEASEYIEEFVGNNGLLKRLESVDGIGKDRAKSISKQLSEKDLDFSGFMELDDLTVFDGIGPATEEQIRNKFVVIEEDEQEETEEEVENEENDSVKPSPTTRKVKQIKKEFSGAAQKYIGKSKY